MNGKLTLLSVFATTGVLIMLRVAVNAIVRAADRRRQRRAAQEEMDAWKAMQKPREREGPPVWNIEGTKLGDRFEEHLQRRDREGMNG